MGPLVRAIPPPQALHNPMGPLVRAIPPPQALHNPMGPLVRAIPPPQALQHPADYQQLLFAPLMPMAPLSSACAGYANANW